MERRWRRWKYQRGVLRSLAGWNEDTKATLAFPALLKEMETNLSRWRRDDSMAFGTPYWELFVAHQLRMSVSEYRNLPKNERLAFKEYFRYKTSVRRRLVEESFEYDEEMLMDLFRRSREDGEREETVQN
ncbi:MAG: hypothetical protein OXG81_02710 [Acidobacteria bacterium]|nr:hypothetical protein [Acidobacteriota bacterium]